MQNVMYARHKCLELYWAEVLDELSEEQTQRAAGGGPSAGNGGLDMEPVPLRSQGGCIVS